MQNLNHCDARQTTAASMWKFSKVYVNPPEAGAQFPQINSFHRRYENTDLFLWAAPSPSILMPPNLPAMPAGKNLSTAQQHSKQETAKIRQHTANGKEQTVISIIITCLALLCPGALACAVESDRLPLLPCFCSCPTVVTLAALLLQIAM